MKTRKMMTAYVFPLLLLGITFLHISCSDNEGDESIQSPENNNTNNAGNQEEEPKEEVIKGERSMWVSYDPNYKEVKQHTSGYSHALISWRLLPDRKSVV